MNRHRVSDKEYMAALESGQSEAVSEVRARSIRYVADREVIEIVTTSGCGFLIPRQWVDALRDVSIDDLDHLTIWPDGSAIELERLDIHIGVDGLITDMLPAMLPANAVAALFASRGGKATSAAKRTSARAKGRKGGRPPKATNPKVA